MKVKLIVAWIFYVALCQVILATTNSNAGNNDNEEVPSEYVLSSRVMDDESALILLRRQTELTYQLNMDKYQKELETVAPEMLPKFEDKDFSVVGSLATLDASVVFYEGIRNLQFIRRRKAEGYFLLAGNPSPTNDKLHNTLQRMNAFRNILWLVKEKLKSGVVTADQPLMDKLREAQTWLSTQTGGHLGQGMTAAFEKTGLMNKLKAKWGATSLKFRTFSAVAANGLDFAINGYNTVVNSIALDQELTNSNILALSSSVTAMAGDIAMAVSQILSSSAKVATAAGPIGYAVAATLYIASYATGVASGLVDQDNFTTKDYVKIFLGPLIPDPTFGALVDMIDEAKKGNTERVRDIFLTQSTPAAFVFAGMFYSDFFTGSNELGKFFKFLSFKNAFQHIKNQIKFKKEMKADATLRDLVQKLKPKKFLYAFPNIIKRNEYDPNGWRSPSHLKSDFGITSNLSKYVVFMATYKSNFAKPNTDFLCDSVEKGATFCPKVLEHSDDPLMFLGNNLDEVIVLDGNAEVYGMGGNDKIYVRGQLPGTIKINGGEGSDTIDTTLGPYDDKAENIESFLTGGGPEQDNIDTGKANDFVVVENDFVSDKGGTNTFFVKGSGNDFIDTGPGAGLIVVKKQSASIMVINSFAQRNGNDQKPKRIVLESGSLTTVHGSSTPNDVLYMKNFKPVQSTGSSDAMVVLVPSSSSHNVVFELIKDIYTEFFKDTLCSQNSDLSANPPVYCPKANEKPNIVCDQIERFELSVHVVNLVLVGSSQDHDRTTTREIISGPKDLYAINLYGSPLIVQMGTGRNRVFSGKGNDAYSLVLDRSPDIIYDKGGENLVAITLPGEVEFCDVWLEPKKDEFTFYCGYYRFHWEKCLRYIFYDDPEDRDAKVQFVVRDHLGREIQFNMITRQRFWPESKKSRMLNPNVSRLSSIYYLKKDSGWHEDAVISVSPAKGENAEKPIGLSCSNRPLPSQKSTYPWKYQQIVKSSKKQYINQEEDCFFKYSNTEDKAKK